jgi:hypothetical protein
VRVCVCAWVNWCGRPSNRPRRVGGRLTVRTPHLAVPTRFQDGLPATPAEPSYWTSRRELNARPPPSDGGALFLRATRRHWASCWAAGRPAARRARHHVLECQRRGERFAQYGHVTWVAQKHVKTPEGDGATTPGAAGVRRRARGVVLGDYRCPRADHGLHRVLPGKRRQREIARSRLSALSTTAGSAVMVRADLLSRWCIPEQSKLDPDRYARPALPLN